MSDDEGRNEEVITLESQDIEIQELPEFPDREEFVKTQEMDGPARDETQPRREHLSTQPMQPVLEKTTQRYDVPDSLLEEARRTQVVKAGDWIEFDARPDENGRIHLPASLQRSLGRGALRIRIQPLEPSDE